MKKVKIINPWKQIEDMNKTKINQHNKFQDHS